jgi:hypothetical protein
VDFNWYERAVIESSRIGLLSPAARRIFADYFAAPAASAAASPVDGFFLRRIRISAANFICWRQTRFAGRKRIPLQALEIRRGRAALFRPRAWKNRRKSRTSRGSPLLQPAGNEFR